MLPPPAANCYARLQRQTQCVSQESLRGVPLLASWGCVLHCQVTTAFWRGHRLCVVSITQTQASKACKTSTNVLGICNMSLVGHCSSCVLLGSTSAQQLRHGRLNL